MAGWIALGVLVAVIVLPWALMIRRQRLRSGQGAGPMLRERQRLIDNRHGKPAFLSSREYKYGMHGRHDRN
jgi:hypothetical protein